MKRIVSFVLATLLLGATPCWAAVELTAYASLDWSSFTDATIKTGVGTPVFSFVGAGEGTVVGYASTGVPSFDDDFDFEAADWTTPLTGTATTDQASSTATRTTSILSATSTSEQAVMPAGFNWSYAAASNFHEFEFSGEGLLTFTVPFSISVEGTPGDDLNFSYANVGLGLSLIDEKGVESDVDSLFSLDSRDDGTTGLIEGTLTASFYNAIEEKTFTGGIWAWASTDANTANVPEPSSFILMLGGLGFVGFAARRKLKK